MNHNELLHRWWPLLIYNLSSAFYYFDSWQVPCNKDTISYAERHGMMLLPVGSKIIYPCWVGHPSGSGTYDLMPRRSSIYGSIYSERYAKQYYVFVKADSLITKEAA